MSFSMGRQFLANHYGRGFGSIIKLRATH